MQLSSLTRFLAYRRALIVGVHVALIPLGYLAAFGIRFDFQIPPAYLARYRDTILYLLAIRLALFQRFGLFRGYWQHVGIRDLVDLAAAVTLSSILFMATLVALALDQGMPRSVLVLDWLIMIFLSGGVRFAARCVREGHLPMTSPRGTRTFLLGAGDAAEQLLRQIQHERGNAMYVVGLLDDNSDKHGRSLHGVPVLGSTDELPQLAARHRIERLVIAISSASGEQMRRLVARCTATGIEFKILPPLQDLLTGRARLGELRDVEIEDLLGREPVNLDLDQVQRDIAGKTILVTGGAGSIGSELARQIGRFRPRRVILLDRAESPLYFAHLEVSRTNPHVEVVPFIANITNGERLDELFRTYRPDYVFHAAAYKHVPMLEANVLEGVWNNVVGTLRVAERAARAGVQKFVLISTDKAVNPTSVLGATKRIAERIVLELPVLRGSHTDFRVVRFGNVLGSDGSVIPLFRRQLAVGGPLTVTHPEVQRYFMTIPEAAQLVLKAAALAEAAGRTSILEMGKPVRILDLAEQLIRLSGLVPYRDVQIVFTGLRPGEKLDEELVRSSERSLSATAEKIRIVHQTGADGADIEVGLQRLIAATILGEAPALIREVCAFVPEYVPWSADTARAPARSADGTDAARPPVIPLFPAPPSLSGSARA